MPDIFNRNSLNAFGFAALGIELAEVEAGIASGMLPNSLYSRAIRAVYHRACGAEYCHYGRPDRRREMSNSCIVADI